MGPEASGSVVHDFSEDDNALDEHESIGAEEIEELTTGGRKLWVNVQDLGDERLMPKQVESRNVASGSSSTPAQ